MNCPYPARLCTKCGRLLIVCPNNFVKKKGGKYGYASQCKICSNKQKTKYREENREKIRKRDKELYWKNHEKRLNAKKEDYEKHKESRLISCKKYYENNKEKILDKQKDYYKKTYEERKDELKIRQKIYRENNKEKEQMRHKKYKLNNPQKVFNWHNKRRLNKENRGSGISKQQWKEMMEYFDWKCAYSGEQLNDNNRTIDHIVSLNKNGENEIWNCVPMAKKYNCSKRDSDFLEWYKSQDFFDEEKLNKIYEWQEYAKIKYK